MKNHFSIFPLILLSYFFYISSHAIVDRDLRWKTDESSQYVYSKELSAALAIFIQKKIKSDQNLVTQQNELEQIELIKTQEDGKTSPLIIKIPKALFDRNKDKFEQYGAELKSFGHDWLTHQTSMEIIFKILEDGEIKTRRQIAPNDTRPCNGSVIYTMIQPEWTIVPMDSIEINSGVAIGLPLELLNGNQWHITPSWNYGEISSESADSNFPEAVNNILAKFKEVLELWLLSHESNTKKTFRRNQFGQQVVFLKTTNEVIFRGPIKLSNENTDFDFSNIPLPLFFQSTKIRKVFLDEFKKREKANLNWEIIKGPVNMTESGVPFVMIKRK